MGLFFLFGFILWGWAEMSAFIYVGGEIGGLLTLLGIFVTAIIGLSLLKSQGSSVMIKIRTDLAQGRAPVGSVADSLTGCWWYFDADTWLCDRWYWCFIIYSGATHNCRGVDVRSIGHK